MVLADGKGRIDGWMDGRKGKDQPRADRTKTARMAEEAFLGGICGSRLEKLPQLQKRNCMSLGDGRFEAAVVLTSGPAVVRGGTYSTLN